MTILEHCTPDSQQWEFYKQQGGIAVYTCKKCGEWREQLEDTGCGG